MPTTPAGPGLPSAHVLPVSEAESPKLKMALYSGLLPPPLATAVLAESATVRKQHEKRVAAATPPMPILMMAKEPRKSRCAAILPGKWTNHVYTINTDISFLMIWVRGQANARLIGLSYHIKIYIARTSMLLLALL